jgi:hypothetical protein
MHDAQAERQPETRTTDDRRIAHPPIRHRASRGGGPLLTRWLLTVPGQPTTCVGWSIYAPKDLRRALRPNSWVDQKHQ